MRKGIVIYSSEPESASKVQFLYESILGDLYEFIVSNPKQTEQIASNYDTIVLDCAMVEELNQTENLFKNGLRLVPFSEDDFKEVVKHIGKIKKGQTPKELGHFYH